ncbi:hypothetical protein BKA70DRAFT_713683 [Coprinopsis sp. MPI-PUGE-AT-0042]|nr:hypothetical protein BKA70DRAFT_713683 [Coprinopsis sp. MPI-PUGE-AT-0042]
MQVYGSFLVVLSAFIATASAVPMPQAPTAASSYSVAIAATSGFAYPSVSGVFPTAPAPPKVTAAPVAPIGRLPPYTTMRLHPNGKVEIVDKGPEHKPVHEAPKHVPEVEHKSSTVVVVPGGKHHSFDRWGGLESLRGFDDFYGLDNWDGFKYEQTFVRDRDLVCRPHESHIIQQRLLVVQEMAKRTILESLCDVEAQTIVWEQFLSGLHGFERDIVRAPRGHHRVGFDEGIVSHFPKFVNHDGSLNVDDWRFSGRDLGKHTVVVRGDNWDDKRSFQSVRRAWQAARNAYFNIHGQFFN